MMRVITAVRFASALGALLALMTSGAGATTLTITNSDFDSPSTTSFQNTISNWSSSSNSFTGVYNLSAFGDSSGAPGGNTQAAFVNPGVDISTVGGSMQALSGDNLAAGTYTLTVYIDQRGGTAELSATIELLAGSNIVGTLTQSPVGLDSWSLVTLTETVTSATAGFGDALGIQLAVGSSSDGGAVDFDNVNLNFTPLATPLPGALPLFATGLGAMGLSGWRRKRKAAALAAA
jgi:hapalindole biogenesis HpiC1 cyclase-like protein